jgi:hypothetical protein
MSAMTEKKRSLLDEKLTLAEARARIRELKAVKKIEGRTSAAARTSHERGPGTTKGRS